MSTRFLVQVPRHARGLDLLSWEDRRRMLATEGREFTVRKLIELMGPLHVSHPSYTPRPRSLLPMPNLAGRQPVWEYTNPSLWSLCKQLFAWMAQ